MSGAGGFGVPPPQPVQLTAGPIRWDNPIPLPFFFFFFLKYKQGRKEDLRGGHHHPAGSFPDSIRRANSSSPFWGAFPPMGPAFSPDGLFGGVCYFPRRHPMEGQAGWK